MSSSSINNNFNNNKNKYYKATITTTKSSKNSPSSNNIARWNGSQACAACKYQRRKCAPDCILAPYFPHDRQRQFLNAHKLFGVSNITKIIRYLDPPDKDQAMRTIIYQSDARANDPVGGCSRIIRNLQRQIEYSRAELQIVLHQLAICRSAAQNQTSFLHPQQIDQQFPPPDDDIDIDIDVDGSRRVIGSMMNNYNNNQPHQHHYDHQQQLPQEEDIIDDERNYFLQNCDDHGGTGAAGLDLQVKQPFEQECREDVKPTAFDDVRGIYQRQDPVVDDDIDINNDHYDEFKFEQLQGVQDHKTIDNVHNLHLN